MEKDTVTSLISALNDTQYGFLTGKEQIGVGAVFSVTERGRRHSQELPEQGNCNQARVERQAVVRARDTVCGAESFSTCGRKFPNPVDKRNNFD